MSRRSADAGERQSATTSTRATLLAVVRERGQVLILAAILLSIPLFPGTVPGGIHGLGIVTGAAIALQAMALIVVYRANRIINFAQVQIGALAGMLFVVLVRYHAILRMIRAVCPPCIDRPSAGVLRFNYYLSLVLAMALAITLSWLVYVFIVRRFEKAPRLVLTVATIFLAQLLAGLQAGLPTWLTDESQRELGLQLGPVGAPFSWDFRIAPTTFHATDVLLVGAAVVALVGIGLYLRRSSTGTAIRAAAENPARVATLGVNVSAVTGRVWLLAGALAGAGAVLQAMATGAQGGGGQAVQATLQIGSTIRVLAAAVIGGMASLPLAAVAAAVIGVLEQAVRWAFNSAEYMDAILLVVIGAALLVQRSRLSRAEIEQTAGWTADRQIRPTPRELSELSSVRRWRRNIAITGVSLLLLLPWALSSQQTNLATTFLIYGLIGLSLLILTGWAGQISLGQFAFAALGAYVTAASGLPWPIALLAAGLAGSVAALLMGLPALKLHGLHLAILTLTFAATATSLLLNPSHLGSVLPRTVERPTLVGMQMEDERVFYYFMIVISALAIAAVIGIRRSRLARALIAARDNEQAAQSFGVDLFRARLAAFAISGFIAAVAGGIFAYHQHSVSATAFKPDQSIAMFILAAIGGLGTIAGPYLGALYVGLLTLLPSSSIVSFLATGGGGLFVLLAVPGGFAQLIFGIRDAVLRRVAVRRHIVVPSLLADVRADGSRDYRAAIAPKTLSEGATAFVPTRYRVGQQWALGLSEEDLLPAGATPHGANGNGSAKRAGRTSRREG